MFSQLILQLKRGEDPCAEYSNRMKDELDEPFALHEHSYPGLLTLKGYITLFSIGAHASVRRVKVESAVQRAKELSIDYKCAPPDLYPERGGFSYIANHG